jgi:hypothetical protein
MIALIEVTEDLIPVWLVSRMAEDMMLKDLSSPLQNRTLA